jgi:hypothetical protein
MWMHLILAIIKNDATGHPGCQPSLYMNQNK